MIIFYLEVVQLDIVAFVWNFVDGVEDTIIRSDPDWINI